MRILGTLALVLSLVLTGCLGTGDELGDDATVGDGVIERQLSEPEWTASEVSIAADPTDPEHLVAASNLAGTEQDGFGVYVTWDAGETWEASLFPAADVARLPGGEPRFRSVSDPVVAFGPQGTVYLAGLAFLPTSAVFVAVSHDGGASWEESHIVDESDVVSDFNDKEWLTVSPETGTLIMAWQKEPALDQLRGVEAATGLDVDIGNVVVARSTDGGQTWSEPVEIDRGMHNNGTQVAIARDGQVHALWVNYETDTLDYVQSATDGQSWSDPVAIADVDTVPAFARFPRMHTLPALAVSETGQEVYAVWHDNRSGDADVFAVASADGGLSWGEPVRVTQDEPGNGVLQMYPWAAVDPQGRLHVTFYDARDDPDHPRFRLYHAVADGPALAFAPARPVSSTPFTAFQEPGCGGPQQESCQEGRSLGDYTGLAASSAGVFPAWADGRGEQASVWAARILPSAG